jgi:uncharacterized protein
MSRPLGMFPLSLVLFPQAELPLHVFEERYRLLMRDCMAADARFGVVLISRGSEVGGGDQRFDTGTVAQISQIGALEDGRLMVLARGVHRCRVTTWSTDSPYPRAEVDAYPLERADSDHDAVAVAGIAVRRLHSLLSELGEVPALPHDLALDDDLEVAGWQLCDLAPLGPIDRQRLLDEPGLSGQMATLTILCDAMAGDVLGLLSGDFDR